MTVFQPFYDESSQKHHGKWHEDELSVLEKCEIIDKLEISRPRTELPGSPTQFLSPPTHDDS